MIELLKAMQKHKETVQVSAHLFRTHLRRSAPYGSIFKKRGGSLSVINSQMPAGYETVSVSVTKLFRDDESDLQRLQIVIPPGKALKAVFVRLAPFSCDATLF